MSKTATASKSPRRTIPLDTEPLTPADFKAIREADEAFARGDYCTLDDLGRDANARLEQLLLEGVRSGPGIPVTKQWWKERYAALARHRQERARTHRKRG